MIGGRLRVDSYVYWPYGHGVPLDQIKQRNSEIDSAYKGTPAELQTVIEKYHVSYVYVGDDELSNYPGCNQRFDNTTFLKPVYFNQQLEIYQVELNQTGT